MKHFDSIINIDFTAQMENQLDLIAEGKANYITVIRNFYDMFNKFNISHSIFKQYVYSNSCRVNTYFMLLFSSGLFYVRKEKEIKELLLTMV